MVIRDEWSMRLVRNPVCSFRLVALAEDLCRQLLERITREAECQQSSEYDAHGWKKLSEIGREVFSCRGVRLQRQPVTPTPCRASATSVDSDMIYSNTQNYQQSWEGMEGATRSQGENVRDAELRHHRGMLVHHLLNLLVSW